MNQPNYPQDPWNQRGNIPPTPQYPPNRNFNKSNRVIFVVLGSMLAVILLIAVGIFVFYSSLSSNETTKIALMHEIANRVESTGSMGEREVIRVPKVDPTCIPSNVACHRLHFKWEHSGDISSYDIEQMMGVTLDDTNYRGCSVGKESGLQVEVCASDNQVNLYIQD
jgi:hypothetical protein